MLTRPSLTNLIGRICHILSLCALMSFSTSGYAKDKVIDNFTYFRILDADVREAMKGLETETLLPIAEKVLTDVGLRSQFDKTQKDIPVEGYYGDTPELTRYFKVMRVLQDNYTDEQKADALKASNPGSYANLKLLSDVYSHEVFGIKPGKLSTFHTDPSKVFDPEAEKGTIAPMADPLTIAFKNLNPQAWQIDTIFKRVDANDLGTGLAGFAYFVDSKTPGLGAQNPLATTLAMETTVLSRMKAQTRGIVMRSEVEWKVDDEVRAFGERVIDAYNSMSRILGVQEGFLGIIDKDNAGEKAEKLSDDDMIRIVNIAINQQSNPPGYYHWVIVRANNDIGFQVIDKVATEIITTKMWKETQGNTILPRSATMHAKTFGDLWTGLKEVKADELYEMNAEGMNFSISVNRDVTAYFKKFDVTGNKNQLITKLPENDKPVLNRLETRYVKIPFTKETANLRLVVDGETLKIYGQDKVGNELSEEGLWVTIESGLMKRD